jgi:hypothetical protein
VLGDGEYALHEAAELLPVASSVTLLTNGREPSGDIPSKLALIKQEIEALEGEDVLHSVRFKDGSALSLNGVFVAVGVAGSTDLAKKLGAGTEARRFRWMRTCRQISRTFRSGRLHGRHAADRKSGLRGREGGHRGGQIPAGAEKIERGKM